MDISPDFVTSFVTPNAPQPEHQSDAEDASDVRSLFEHSWVFTPIRWDSLIAKASIDGLEYTNIFQIVFNTHLPRLMWKVFCWCLQFYYSYTPNYCVMADLYRYQVCEVCRGTVPRFGKAHGCRAVLRSCWVSQDRTHTCVCHTRKLLYIVWTSSSRTTIRKIWSWDLRCLILRSGVLCSSRWM